MRSSMNILFWNLGAFLAHIYDFRFVFYFLFVHTGKREKFIVHFSVELIKTHSCVHPANEHSDCASEDVKRRGEGVVLCAHSSSSSDRVMWSEREPGQQWAVSAGQRAERGQQWPMARQRERSWPQADSQWRTGCQHWHEAVLWGPLWNVRKLLLRNPGHVETNKDSDDCTKNKHSIPM